MRKSKKRNLTKQIICIIIFLMLCNFIVPNNTYAVEVDDIQKGDTGDLFVSLAQLFCFVPDAVMNVLQHMFISEDDIKTESGEYSIKYSSAAIFSGEIPAFDMNFINPGETDFKQFIKEQAKNNTFYEDCSGIDEYNEKMRTAEEAKDEEGDILYKQVYTESEYGTTTIEYDGYYQGSYSVDELDHSETVINSSTAAILQPVIARWYNALRKIALVGLLSVLVYIGIRIVLTSTSAKDKAKYKKMLMNWLVAFCILFTLHYIMNITITVVSEVTEMIKSTAIGADGEDVLMSAVRNDIANADNWGEAIVQIFIYCMLTVYSIIFTVQYIRRTIYIAFLTVIAPLITLTYPLDKIKDNKSQAFDMWIKDYVFFSLLQVVHILIYYILVGSSMNLTKSGNWIFAVVAIGFITKAEKYVKKLFGFKKSKTMGAMAAGATGALVMDVMKKIQIKDEKKSENGKKGNNVRTATDDPIDKLRAKGSGINTGSTTNNQLPSHTPTTVKEVAIKGAKTYGGEMFKKLGEGTLETISSVSFAMITAAAAAVDGDMSDVVTGAMLGANVGKSVAKKGISTLKNSKKSADKVRDTYNQGKDGKETAQNAKFDREFRSSEEYKEFRRTFGDSVSDEDVQNMLNAGITDVNDMAKIIDNVAVGNIDSLEDAMGYFALSQLCSDEIFFSDSKLRQWLDDYGLDQADLQTMRDRMNNFRS